MTRNAGQRVAQAVQACCSATWPRPRAANLDAACRKMRPQDTRRFDPLVPGRPGESANGGGHAAKVFSRIALLAPVARSTMNTAGRILGYLDEMPGACSAIQIVVQVGDEHVPCSPDPRWPRRHACRKVASSGRPTKTGREHSAVSSLCPAVDESPRQGSEAKHARNSDQISIARQALTKRQRNGRLRCAGKKRQPRSPGRNQNKGQRRYARRLRIDERQPGAERLGKNQVRST